MGASVPYSTVPAKTCSFPRCYTYNLLLANTFVNPCPVTTNSVEVGGCLITWCCWSWNDAGLAQWQRANGDKAHQGVSGRAWTRAGVFLFGLVCGCVRWGLFSTEGTALKVLRTRRRSEQRY